MKYVLYVAIILACALMIRGQRCNKSKTCGKGKCCVTYIPGRFFIPFGQCQRLLKEGDKCMPDFLHNMAGKGKYFVKCPCEEGLECTSETGDDSQSGELRCMRPDATTVTETQTEQEETTIATKITEEESEEEMTVKDIPPTKQVTISEE